VLSWGYELFFVENNVERKEFASVIRYLAVERSLGNDWAMGIDHNLELCKDIRYSD
jgi:hypothetical protein